MAKSKKQVEPQVMSIDQVRDCAVHCENLRKYRRVLDRLEQNPNQFHVHVQFGNQGGPPWLETMELSPFSPQEEPWPCRVQVIEALRLYFESIVESLENTLREFGVDPDKQEDD